MSGEAWSPVVACTDSARIDALSEHWSYDMDPDHTRSNLELASGCASTNETMDRTFDVRESLLIEGAWAGPWTGTCLLGEDLGRELLSSRCFISALLFVFTFSTSRAQRDCERSLSDRSQRSDSLSSYCQQRIDTFCLLLWFLADPSIVISSLCPQYKICK